MSSSAPDARAGMGAARVSRFRFAEIAVTAFIGAGLLGLGLPRLLSEVARVPAHESLIGIQTGAPVTPDALARARAALDTAIARDSGNGRFRTDRALVALVERAHHPEDEWRAALLSSAIADLEAGLADAPVNSFAWARLAAARIEEAGAPTDAALAALRLSYATGPFVDKIMPFRAELALVHWPDLDGALRSAAEQDMAYLWARSWPDQEALLLSACRTGRGVVLASAIGKARGDLAAFDRLYPPYLSRAGCGAKARAKT